MNQDTSLSIADPGELDDQEQIAALIIDWTAAVRAKDTAAVVVDHTRDMVMFDVPAPNRLDGIEAYRQSWKPFFEWFGDDGRFEIETLDVTAGDDVAYATAILKCGKPDTLKGSDTRLRLTVGLRREGDRWKIAHEHHSFPQTD